MRLARLVIVSLSVAACGAAVAPPVAMAGGYDIHACNPGVAGGANNSFYSVASAGMAAYAECPAGQGITVRNAWDNGSSGFLDGAFMIFDAPGGNVVDNVSYEAGYQRHHCSWGLGVIASGYDLGGTRVWGLPPGGDCTALETPGPTAYFPVRWSYAINAPRVRVESRCGAGSCPRNGVATMRLRNVQVRVRDDVAPVLTNGRGALWTGDAWLAGTQSVGFSADDPAGIRENAVRVDEKDLVRQNSQCDYTRPAPCPSGSLDEPLNTVAWGGDGPHTLTIEALDAAGNRGAVSRTVRVDNTAPDPPKDLAVDGGDGWRSGNAFDVRWTNMPQKFAPIAGAEYELCPTSGGTCTRGRRDASGITAIDKLEVPAPGEYELKLWLRDSAGNQDARLTGAPTRLRYDDASPELAFQALNAEDPTRIAVETSDRGSGVASGLIEIRRRDGGQWAQLPTVLDGRELVARIDDERLGDGVFELRARATDHAGNERSTDHRVDGGPANVTLPLRLKTHLRAGVVRRSRGRVRLARVARVGYGRVVRVSGRLTSQEGNPLQDFEVQAVTQIRDGVTPPVVVATVRTSRTGRFSFLVRRGPSRTIRIRYAGAAQIRSAARELVLHVRSRTTLRPNRRSFIAGETVRLGGKLTTGRVPSTGKLVELQVLVRKRWRTFATTRTGARGGWRYDYRFDGTKGRVTYRMRARVPREAGYPFVTGHSRVVRLKVRGL